MTTYAAVNKLLDMCRKDCLPDLSRRELLHFMCTEEVALMICSKAKWRRDFLEIRPKAKPDRRQLELFSEGKRK